jgi:hypothetical protein
MTPTPYDLIIGLDRADKKADLCLLETATGQRVANCRSATIPTSGCAESGNRRLQSRFNGTIRTWCRQQKLMPP